MLLRRRLSRKAAASLLASVGFFTRIYRETSTRKTFHVFVSTIEIDLRHVEEGMYKAGAVARDVEGPANVPI
jgi:hypothetical protein